MIFGSMSNESLIGVNYALLGVFGALLVVALVSAIVTRLLTLSERVSQVEWIVRGVVVVVALAGGFLTLMPDIVFRGNLPLWGVIALGALAIALSFYTYFNESMRLTNPRRTTLAVFRSLVLLAIVFLICKPVWVRDVSGVKNRPVQLMIDNSQSMTNKDTLLDVADQVRQAIAADRLPPDNGLTAPGDSNLLVSEKKARIDIVKAIFDNKRLDLVPKLRNLGPVQPMLFGSRTRGFADNTERTWYVGLTAEDTKTALTDALNELMQRDSNDLPGSIVLVTDGRDNASETEWDTLALQAKKLNVPIYIYGVGGSGAGYLQLKEASVKEAIFAEDTVNVPFRWRANGIKNGEVELQVKLGDRIVATKKMAIKEGDDLSEILSFRPTKDDVSTSKKLFTASIKVTHAGETLTDNITKEIRVADAKVKLLYIEDVPRWEFKFMQRALIRDQRVDPTFLIMKGDKEVMAKPPFRLNFPDTRAELFEYHMLILGDVALGDFTDTQLQWINDFVYEGGGLVVISGRQNMPTKWIGKESVAKIFPIEAQAIKFPIDTSKRPLEFRPVRSEFGKRSSMLSFSDDPEENERVWNDLPGWYWNYPVTKLRPAAVALLEHPKNKIADEKPEPIVAMHYYGQGLSLFFAGEETWRWRYNEADKYFSRFWGQVIYAVGLPKALGGNAGQLALANGEAQLGKPGQVYARLFNADFIPKIDDQVTAQLERIDDAPGGEKFRRVIFERLPNTKGEYVATIPNDYVGKYVLKVNSGKGDVNLQYRVTMPPEHEMSPGPMNELALRRLAEMSGGKFYREEDLFKMSQDIKPQEVSFTQRRETLLWNNWWVLIAVVSLFTFEWLIRKFSNMS